MLLLKPGRVFVKWKNRQFPAQSFASRFKRKTKQKSSCEPRSISRKTARVGILRSLFVAPGSMVISLSKRGRHHHPHWRRENKMRKFPLPPPSNTSLLIVLRLFQICQIYFIGIFPSEGSYSRAILKRF